MTLHTALALSVVAAAAWLFFAFPARILSGVALLCGGVEVAMSQGWLRLAAHGPSVSLVLGAGIAVPALVLWWRAGGKGPLTAASVLAYLGLLQTALALAVRL